MSKIVVEMQWTGLPNQISFRLDPWVYFDTRFGNLLAHGVDGLVLIVVAYMKVIVTKHPEAAWGKVIPSLERFLREHFGEDTVIVRPEIPLS